MDEIATLKVDNLQKKYGRTFVVDGVSFEMRAGEVVGFLGPNGAGKTTCFYMIVGFIRPNAGTIWLNQHNITHKAMYKRARAGISYLPQEASVFRKLSVEDNIWSILETRRGITRKAKRELLENLLHELDIVRVRKQKAFTLSGGERRRTEIARALAIEPRFLLLDEPFAGIDPIAVQEIKRIIAILVSKGIGVLITDHNVRDTLSITDRVYIIRQGKIVAAGSRDEISENSLARELYLGADFVL